MEILTVTIDTETGNVEIEFCGNWNIKGCHAVKEAITRAMTETRSIESSVERDSLETYAVLNPVL